MFMRVMLFALLTMMSIIAAGLHAQALIDDNRATINYEPDDSIFPNPERGFFISIQPSGGGRVGQRDTPHPPLKVEDLEALRDRPEKITLIRDYILIPRKFWEQPISADYLKELQNNFNAVRLAGLKVFPRFLYDWGMQNRDPDEAVILRHLDELTPLIRNNSDIIAWVQGGLFGGCGEQCHSDHGYVYDKYSKPNSTMRWQGLSEAGRRILLKELSIILPDRMMLVRYPRLKWDLFGWTSADALQHARTVENAFDGSDVSRIGYYNEGFLGSPEHFAMFQLDNESEFTHRDSAFVIHEGEISNANAFKLQPGLVVKEMERYHQTALNCGGDDWEKVAEGWKKNGDYDTVARRMGYRFRLIRATMSKRVRPGGSFRLEMEMTNDGFARPMNPRGVELILRNHHTHERLVLTHDAGRGNRLWLPGPGETKNLIIEGGIPPDAQGTYEALLNLPDPNESLHDYPDYAIRLANKNAWEPGCGYNKLNHNPAIDPAAGGALYEGKNYFVPKPMAVDMTH